MTASELAEARARHDAAAAELQVLHELQSDTQSTHQFTSAELAALRSTHAETDAAARAAASEVVSLKSERDVLTAELAASRSLVDQMQELAGRSGPLAEQLSALRTAHEASVTKLKSKEERAMAAIWRAMQNKVTLKLVKKWRLKAQQHKVIRKVAARLAGATVSSTFFELAKYARVQRTMKRKQRQLQVSLLMMHTRSSMRVWREVVRQKRMVRKMAQRLQGRNLGLQGFDGVAARAAIAEHGLGVVGAVEVSAQEILSDLLSAMIAPALEQRFLTALLLVAAVRRHERMHSPAELVVVELSRLQAVELVDGGWDEAVHAADGACRTHRQV
jgi:hypothetical protein